MQLIVLPGFYILYFCIGFILEKPYMKLPMHHHFGVWAWWAYFNRPVPNIPKHVVTGNQGWFRIYLHYLFLAFFSLFGRENFLPKLRLFMTSYNALTSLAVHAVALQAGMPLGEAVLCAVLFLYLISRPQLTGYFVNAEPYAILFTTLSLGVLIASVQALPANPVLAAYLFLAFSFLYGLTSLLNKLSHAVEYGIIFITYCLVTRMFSLWLVCGLAGWILAAALFGLCFRRHIYKDGVTCFLNYISLFSSMTLKDTVMHHRTYLPPVLKAIGVFVAAALLGMDLFGNLGPSRQVIGIFLMASLAGLVIQRSYLFHHWVAVLPFIALCAGDFLYSIPQLPSPWAGLAAAAVAIPLALRLPDDLKAYVITEPYALGRHIFGKNAWMFFNPLCPQAAALSRQEPFAQAKVMFWSINVELYIISGRIPECMEQPFCGASVYLFTPTYDDLLTQSFAADPPRYIFDLNCLGVYEHLGSFSPLLLYIRTGLRYRPRQVEQGYLVYELMDVKAPPVPKAGFKLMTPIYSQEQTLIRENYKELFHIIPGNESQLVGLRLLVSEARLFEYMEAILRRRLVEEDSGRNEEGPGTIEYRSLRLQILSWLSPEAVAAVRAPNALPLHLALMAYSVGKDDLARYYAGLIDPSFIEQCAPLSLAFTLGLELLRMLEEDDRRLRFPRDAGLYFSERPRNIVPFLRLVDAYLRWSPPDAEERATLEWVLDSLYVEQGLPSALDAMNQEAIERTRRGLAAPQEVTTS